MSLNVPEWDGVERRKIDLCPHDTAELQVLRTVEQGFDLKEITTHLYHPYSDDPRENHVRNRELTYHPGRTVRFEYDHLRSQLRERDESVIGQFVETLVDSDYQNTLDAITARGLYNPEQGDSTAPTLEQVKTILKTLITPDQFTAIQEMETPVLQLVPLTSMNRYLKAMEGKLFVSLLKDDPQSGSLLSGMHGRAFKKADKRDEVTGDEVTGWKVAITEGGQQKEFERDYHTLWQRAWGFRDYYNYQYVSGINYKKMILLMITSLHNGIPINSYKHENHDNVTFINEEILEGIEISIAGWDEETETFYITHTDERYRHDFAHIRTSVEYNVPKVA